MGKVNETLSYSAEGQELKGYLAFDDDAGPRPGVMVIHEWWGLDTYIRERTDRLAELGYTASHLTCTVMAGRGEVLTKPGRS
ncbi:MAG: hypothetical protein CM1200mP20_06610 [Pseudomonadota bacterium]|nr:MAG: hypothetical protein CM1200mP20_06610 [Pseudomonadota bacterium]